MTRVSAGQRIYIYRGVMGNTRVRVGNWIFGFNPVASPDQVNRCSPLWAVSNPRSRLSDPGDNNFQLNLALL